MRTNDHIKDHRVQRKRCILRHQLQPGSKELRTPDQTLQGGLETDIQARCRNKEANGFDTEYGEAADAFLLRRKNGKEFRPDSREAQCEFVYSVMRNTERVFCNEVPEIDIT
jgi:hypothetical protein